MRNIKVYYRHSTKGDGHWEEDDSDADYPNEVYIEGEWSHQLVRTDFAFKDLKHAFDNEDGDCDYAKQIVFICETDGKIIFDMDRIKTMEERKRIEEHLLEQASSWVD